jgi:phosphoribosylamine-glycine ligase
MKVLVVGGGGREHALVWKISQSPRVTKIYAAPGNAGMAQLAECVQLKAEDIPGLLDFARAQAIDLTVVGPEGPLSMGIVDEFTKAGLRIFGPSGKAAVIEASKQFSKDLMKKYTMSRPRNTVSSPTGRRPKHMCARKVRRSWSRPTDWQQAKAWWLPKRLRRRSRPWT